MKPLFLILLALIFYTYAGYFLLLSLVGPIARHMRRKHLADESFLPSVSIIISLHNEEKHVAARIQNLLAVDYPPEKLEILVGSDGSTDNTNEIVQRFQDPRVKLHAFSPRRGKASVLNRLVPLAKGELLVFSDANTLFERDALRKLARHFSDSTIGGVCGRLIFRSEGQETEERLYWDLENYLKKCESDLDSCLGANGGIYAIRKSVWTGIPDNTVIDDFVIAMRVSEQGLRVIYDAEAVAVEDMPHKVAHEIARRVRIGAGGFQAIFLCWRSLLPWRGFYSVAFWSHKVLRWFGPFFMVAALVANFTLLPHPFFVATLAAQLAFYGLAAIGALMRDRKTLLFNGPYYFVAINLALFLGFFRFITRTQRAAWKRTAR